MSIATNNYVCIITDQEKAVELFCGLVLKGTLFECYVTKGAFRFLLWHITLQYAKEVNKIYQAKFEIFIK